MIINVPESIGEYHVLEWSPRQEMFHIEKISRMLEVNNRVLFQGKKADYFPIAICKTHDEAHAICDEYEARLRDRPENTPTELVND